MKIALALTYLALIAALFTTGCERYSTGWTVLAASAGVLFVLAFLRIHLVTNSSEADE
jgi:hypothetical protein